MLPSNRSEVQESHSPTTHHASPITYNLTSRTPTLSPTKLYLQNCCKSPKSKSEIYKLSSKNDDHREQRYANEGGSHPRGADLAPLRRNAGSLLNAYKIE